MVTNKCLGRYDVHTRLNLKLYSRLREGKHRPACACRKAVVTSRDARLATRSHGSRTAQPGGWVTGLLTATRLLMIVTRKRLPTPR
jgi:hypothetical protein